MGLVSSVYAMAPRDQSGVSQDESDRRLQRITQRLVTTYGGAEVRRRIRESEADEYMKARLMLYAMTAD